MTDFELFNVLEEYNLSEDGLINCITEVSKANPRIKKSYEETGYKWKDLSIFTIRRILESYNQSIINLKTKEIIGYNEIGEIKVNSNNIFNIIMTLTFNSKFANGTTDVDMFAIVKKEDGHFTTVYFNNVKEPGVILFDWRDFFIPEELGIFPDEIIQVNLKDLEDDVEEIIFCTYLYNENKPKDAFSSMKYMLLNENKKIICEFDATKQMNNSIGVSSFEFIKKDNIWRIRILGEDFKYDLNKLLCTL